MEAASSSEPIVTDSAATKRFASWIYKVRWIGSALLLLLVFGTFAMGLREVAQFTAQVEELADNPRANPEPQMFDPRSDIWFDPEDKALTAYNDLEDQFIAEDPILLSFEEPSDPMGVFGEKALQAIARLSEQVEKVPYVRNVRSLTTNPWIRWGEVAEGESGLLVSDLFENEPATYSESERLQRMIAVMGAARAAKLVGEDKVRQVIGTDAKFEDYQGEPRLLRSVISEDGRATTVMASVLRPKVAPEHLNALFGDGPSHQKAAAPAIHKSTRHSIAVAEIDKIRRGESAYPIHYTGVPVMERHFVDVGQQDMAYVGLMFVAMAVVLLGIYRRVAGVLLPLVVVFATILGMVGFILARGQLLNNLTAIAPTMMTGVGIADAVHLVSAYYMMRPRFKDRRELITAVISRNALPVFLTSVTTAVGFLSLTTSTIIPVKQLGGMAGLGTVLAYLLSMTLVPAVLSLLPLPKQAPERAEDLAAPVAAVPRHWSEPLLHFVLAQRGKLFVVTGVLVVLAGIGFAKVSYGTDIRLMFAKGDPVSDDVVWQGDRIGGAGDVELLFQAPGLDVSAEQLSKQELRLAALQAKKLSPDGSLDASEQKELEELQTFVADAQRRRIAANAEFLGELDRFERKLRVEMDDPNSPLRSFSRVDSALDVLRKVHQVQNENDAAFYRVPSEQDVPEAARRPSVEYDDIAEETVVIPAQSASSMISQYYVQYENGAKPSENLASLITSNRRGFRMTLLQDAVPSRLALDGFARVRQLLHDEFPRLAGTAEQVNQGAALSTVTITGKNYMFTNMFHRFSDTMLSSIGLALVVITLIIGVAFRSPVLALFSLIPNLLPVLLPLAVFGWFGWEVDGPSVAVASVALGVCVDDTIHLFAKFKLAHDQGATAEQALRYAFRHVGGAVTWTSVTLVLGFSVLGLATFRPNVMMGLLGASMIALAWVCDVVLTPAFLSLLTRKEPKAAPGTALEGAPA